MYSQENFVALEDLKYPPEYLKGLAIDEINRHMYNYRRIISHSPRLKEEIEKLEDKLDEAPKNAPPTQEFYEQLDKTKALLQEDELMPPKLKRATSKLIVRIESLTPPPVSLAPLEERACNFFGCTIL